MKLKHGIDNFLQEKELTIYSPFTVLQLFLHFHVTVLSCSYKSRQITYLSCQGGETVWFKNVQSQRLCTAKNYKTKSKLHSRLMKL